MKLISRWELQKAYGHYCNVAREQGLHPVLYSSFKELYEETPTEGKKKYWIEKTIEINGGN